jgi:hypothetical protein
MNFNWKIAQLEHRTSDGFVTTAHWRCDAVDGEFSAGVYGSVGFGEGFPTIPYDNLTEEQVLEWVWESVNKEETEANVSKQLDALKNPEKQSGLPW